MLLTLVQLITFINHSFFSFFPKAVNLPFINSTNSSHTQACGIGTTQPLPSLTIDCVRYAPNCPFHILFVTQLTQFMILFLPSLKKMLSCRITYWVGWFAWDVSDMAFTIFSITINMCINGLFNDDSYPVRSFRINKIVEDGVKLNWVMSIRKICLSIFS